MHKLRLYRAIQQASSRHRRPVSVRQVIERLMWLDEVIDNKDLTWLATVDEKVDFFTRTVPTLALERLPHATVTRGASRSTRLFPDNLPIGVQPDGRVVFPFLITTPFKDAFCEFLQRHSDLLRALPTWTVRLLFPPLGAGLQPFFEEAARHELTGRMADETLRDMRRFFTERWATADVRARWSRRCRVLARRTPLRLPDVSRPVPALADRWRRRVRVHHLARDSRGVGQRNRAHRVVCAAALVRPFGAARRLRVAISAG